MDPNQATKPKLSKTELYYEALAAYVKNNKVGEDWPAMPTRTGTSISQKSVILRNQKFFLAKYDCLKKEFSKPQKS